MRVIFPLNFTTSFTSLSLSLPAITATSIIRRAAISFWTTRMCAVSPKPRSVKLVRHGTAVLLLWLWLCVTFSLSSDRWFTLPNADSKFRGALMLLESWHRRSRLVLLVFCQIGQGFGIRCACMFFLLPFLSSAVRKSDVLHLQLNLDFRSRFRPRKWRASSSYLFFCLLKGPTKQLTYAFLQVKVMVIWIDQHSFFHGYVRESSRRHWRKLT